LIGDKLPALVNASITLVPGDGIYCFGDMPICDDSNQQAGSIDIQMTVRH